MIHTYARKQRYKKDRKRRKNYNEQGLTLDNKANKVNIPYSLDNKANKVNKPCSMPKLNQPLNRFGVYELNQSSKETTLFRVVSLLISSRSSDTPSGDL